MMFLTAGLIQSQSAQCTGTPTSRHAQLPCLFVLLNGLETSPGHGRNLSLFKILRKVLFAHLDQFLF